MSFKVSPHLNHSTIALFYNFMFFPHSTCKKSVESQKSLGNKWKSQRNTPVTVSVHGEGAEAALDGDGAWFVPREALSVLERGRLPEWECRDKLGSHHGQAPTAQVPISTQLH